MGEEPDKGGALQMSTKRGGGGGGGVVEQSDWGEKEQKKVPQKDKRI